MGSLDRRSAIARWWFWAEPFAADSEELTNLEVYLAGG